MEYRSGGRREGVGVRDKREKERERRGLRDEEAEGSAGDASGGNEEGDERREIYANALREGREE